MYKYHKIFSTNQYIRIYPIGDLHHGSQQSDLAFIDAHIGAISKDPNGYAVLMGDLTENNLIGSAGSVYSQETDPHSQMNEIVKRLDPISHKILFGIESNHSVRSYRAAGLSIDKLICEKLRVPFAGYSCYALFTIKNVKRPQNSYAYKCYFHHSRGGSSTIGGKYETGVRLERIVPSADAIFHGHTHHTGRSVTKYWEIEVGGSPSWVEKNRFVYSTGSTLDWDGSYAEELGLRPAVKELISVDFYGVLNGDCHKRQEYKTYSPSDYGLKC